jgi:hypothetical protein
MYTTPLRGSRSAESMHRNLRPGGFFFAVGVLCAQPPTLASQPHALLSQSFEPNRGQADRRVDFVSHGPGYTLLLAPDAAYLNLIPDVTAPAAKGQALRFRLLGANPRVHGEGREPQGGKSNYFIGNSSDLWRTGIPQYSRVLYHQIYRGIDLTYYGAGQRLEYDFVLGPRADPGKIRLAVDGADRIRIDDGGDLVMTVGRAEIREGKPFVYQDTPAGRRRIEASYFPLGGNAVGFKIARYDRRVPLVIDPTLVFSTYFGGNGNDGGHGIALDASGNIYICGVTASTNLSGGDIGQPFSGVSTAFVAEISPSGTLIFSTFIAGADDEAVANGVALDGSGDIYLSGLTYSSSFPVQNPIQAVFGGQLDAFALELNNSGNALIYSTYLGGSLGDYATSISVDAEGNAYVSGTTESSNFPIANASQPALAGSSNAFATKIAALGASLVYSTYIGGNAVDYNNGATIDANGNFYVYGDTSSTNFPVLNAIQPTFCGWQQGEQVQQNHGWVAMLNSLGFPLYSTYVCGSAAGDSVRAAAVDGYGDLFISGNTASTTFPTLNPIQSQYGGGSYDAFVMELSPAGSLLYSTYLGGNGEDLGDGAAIDALGNLYVVGYTYSTNFPTVNPIQSGNAGSSDAFLTKINAAGSAITFSTYLGGSQSDQARGVALDPLARAYLVGQTASNNFAAAAALQPAYGGGSNDAFVSIISTCDFAFSQPGLWAATGGSGSLSINTTPECGWTAASNSGWITVDPPTSGVGNGSISYSVAANTGPTRTGSLTIGGQTVDITQAGVPALSVTLSNTGSFVQGQMGAAYTITVSNGATAGATSGLVTVSETVPASLTLVSMSGVGWTCSTNNCTRTDALNPGASYPPLTVSVNVAANAPAQVTDQATVSGGGSATAAASDPTTIFVTLTSVSTLSFGNQAIGSTSNPQSFTLANNGPNALSLTGIAIGGANPGDFAQSNNCPATLTVSGSCSVTVTFTPTASGTRAAAVTITDNGSGSPQTVGLTGTGVGAGPAVSFSASTLTFANQTINTPSASQGVVLTNNGPGSLTLTAVAITGTNSGDYSQTNNCPATVALNGTCTITVTFTPAAAGTRTAAVTITDNGSGSPQSVALTGTGVIPVVSLAPASLTFANQTVNTRSVSQAITLTNSGPGTLTGKSIALTGTNSGDYSLGSTCSLVMPVNATCTISVTFTPTATGTRTAAVTITDNGSGSPQSVSLTGTGVIPVVSVAPTSLTFANQTVNTSSTSQAVILTNSGPGTLTGKSIALTGTNSGDYSQTNNCPATVALNGTCTITVTFTPAAAGTRTAAVTITDNGSGSPQTVSLTGTGGGLGPVVNLAPVSLTFASQTVNIPSTSQAITLTNSGPGALNVTGVAITGTNSGDYSQTNNCPATVALNGTCTITVTFTPAAAGRRTAAVTITDNGSGSPQSVALTGTGAIPVVSLAPASLTYANQTVNTSSAGQTITLTNSGPGVLSVTGVAITGANSGDYSQTNNCPATVALNGTCTITAIFTPAAAGTRTAAVTITDNGSGSPQAVSLTGTGGGPGPVVNLAPASLTYANQTVNTSSAGQTITLTNSGPGVLSVTGVAITGANSGDYSQTNNCPATVALNGTCTITVIFAPTATGTRTAVVALTDNGGGRQSVALTGTGLAAAPVVSLAPTSLTFANQTLDTSSASQAVTLTNSGPGTLTGKSITLTGANAGDYSLATTCPMVMSLNATCTISVTFTPTATGTRTAAVTITDNGSGSPQSVALTGTGVIPVVNPAPTSLTFASQTVGTSSPTQSITLTNSGPGTLTGKSITLTGANAGDYSLATTCPMVMSVSATCAINVTFTPTAAGTRTAVVALTDNGSGSPQTVTLTGTGVT